MSSLFPSAVSPSLCAGSDARFQINPAAISTYCASYQHPQIQDYVHYVVCWPNSLKVKLNSERAWDIEISHSYQLVALEIDWLKEKARNIIIFL